MQEDKIEKKLLQEIPGLSLSLLTKAPYPIVILNPDRSLRYVNPAFEILTGFCSIDIIGTKPPFPWWGESIITLGHLEQAFQKRRIHMNERFRKKTGDSLRVKIDILFYEIDDKIQYYIAYWVDVTEETHRTEELQSYIREVTIGQDRERKRIAREIHDGAAQALVMAYTDCSSIVKSNQLSITALESLEHVRFKIKDALDELRRLSRKLSPALLDQFGLVPSLELLIEEINKEKTVHCLLNSITSPQSISSEVALNLFRITQEALNNAIQHAEATEITVSIKFTSETVNLIIEDNGKGFNVPEVYGSFSSYGKLGLISMSERASSINGGLTLTSEPDMGTIVEVEAPRWPNQV